MSTWVRNIVTLGTLALVGWLSYLDVKAGNRPDPMVLTIPAGVYVALYLGRKKNGDESGDES